MTKVEKTKPQPPAPAGQQALRTKLRGRPSKAQATLIDADILDIAAELFGQLGYTDTSMEAVAARAGVAKRTLYARYPDKTALLKDVINSIIKRAASPEPMEFLDLRSCLSFHVENYFVICEDPAMRVIVSMGDQSVQNIPELAAIGHELTQSGMEGIARTITETAARTGVAVADPGFFAASLLDLAAGHYTRVRIGKLRSDFASYKFAARRIVSLLVAGIGAEAAGA